LHGLTSAAVLAEVAHRIMTLEACSRFGWGYSGIAAKLKRHPAQVSDLSGFKTAVQAVIELGVGVIPIEE
jgi:hypothetical protein